MTKDKHKEGGKEAAGLELPAEGATGAATGLQPGGTIPGGGPGTSTGSIGTGGGSTANKPSGTAKGAR
jgi:hypothetical protein